MLMTAAVFHPEMSPLNEDALVNMYLGAGCQGWAGRCLDATPPRAAGRQPAARVRRKMKQKCVIEALISSHQPQLVYAIRRGEEQGKQKGKVRGREER